ARDAAVYLRQAVSTPVLASITGARGSRLYGTDGRSWLDFHGNSAHQLGYGHPKLIEALAAQLNDLPFVPRRFTSDVSVEFAEEL
ncbi:aminotransferase class III-fold pyridoxal phosphate-dependent enzyme, partial [Mesorhizobium japonicum]|uniref:aminotransferase class III-fold pyridoxal phosphate-dependent enzyme n=1 Tax=Mesorhizobium japonicum TaxID=2066070 RepID=UPI003B5B9F18